MCLLVYLVFIGLLDFVMLLAIRITLDFGNNFQNDLLKSIFWKQYLSTSYLVFPPILCRYVLRIVSPVAPVSHIRYRTGTIWTAYRYE